GKGTKNKAGNLVYFPTFLLLTFSTHNKTTMNRRKALEQIALAFGAMAFVPSAWAKTEEGTPILLPDPQKKRPLKRKVTAITLGAGNRGNVYGNYGLEYPDELD
ncbi:hypothetical protein RZS08_65735, partial [Arthrospira platensis SPKY1]|nr:hypothetical protein [Arthrospira platensis SPKY1]